MKKKGSKTKASKAAKTNAARLLDQRNITYDCLIYEVDPDDLAAERTAEKLGLAPKQVFKTLVVRGDRSGICFAVIPADTQLELKALAKLSDNRKVAPVALKDVQPLTGYIRGGVTALASKKDYPVYVHDSMTTFDKIAVSAGKRGLMLWLVPQDYIQVAQATVGAIAQ